MRADPVAVVDSFYAAWFARDVDAAASLVGDLVRLTQHIEDPALPFVGTTVGKPAFQQRLEMIFAEWRFLSALPRHLNVEREKVRTVCAFEVLHLATGEVFDGTLRHHWIVRDGLIIHCDEYLDVARLKAFLRLLGLSSGAN